MRIPFISIPDKPLISTTQDFLPIADIADDIVLFKDGSAALIMESSSLNFGLLSERERQAVIAAYSSMLNSFTFPVQILVRSEKKDISTYMTFLEEQQKNMQNPKLEKVMNGYKEFIVEAIKKKNVLSKNFYIVIPFRQIELGVSKSLASNFSKKQETLPFTKSYVLRKVKITLLPKKDHLIRQANRLGIVLRQLKTNEIVRLFYRIYNEPMASRKESKNQNFNRY